MQLYSNSIALPLPGQSDLLPASATSPSETLTQTKSSEQLHHRIRNYHPGYQVIRWDTSFTASYIAGTGRHLIDGRARKACNRL